MGNSDTASGLELAPKSQFYAPYYGTNAVVQAEPSQYWRLGAYMYVNWRATSRLLITGGLAYDWLGQPANVTWAPISEETVEESQGSPKLGLVWNLTTNTTFHGALTRALGGTFSESSVRLEPVQVAGFNQAYRSLFPESLVGYVPGAEFDTAGLGFNQRFRSGTYVGVRAEWLRTQAERQSGVFTKYNPRGTRPPAVPGQLDKDLKYAEDSLGVFAHQLLGEEWSLGATYRLVASRLDTEWLDVPTSVPGASTRENSLLQQLNLNTIFNHPSGLFAHLEGLWTSQSNTEDASPNSAHPFWQFNAYVGYRHRTPRRALEVTLGALNLADQDYRLYPLSPYAELPRERTFAVSVYISL